MARNSENKRGFAAMDEELQRRIASEGGRAAHEKGTAHEFTPEEARVAGRKGGEIVSQNREHMAEIGRKGAEARAHGAANRDSGGRELEDRARSNHRGRQAQPSGSHEQHVQAGQQSHENG